MSSSQNNDTLSDWQTPNSIAQLLYNSVIKANEPSNYGRKSGIYEFALPEDSTAQDLGEMTNYLIRVRRSDPTSRGDDLIPPNQVDITHQLTKHLKHTTSLTPPAFLYQRHIAQPLLTLYDEDAIPVMDIVKKQEGAQITKEIVLEIIENNDPSVFVPIMKDYVALITFGGIIDLGEKNIFYTREGKNITLQLIDQTNDDATFKPVQDVTLGKIGHAIIPDLGKFLSELADIADQAPDVYLLDNLLDEALFQAYHEYMQECEKPQNAFTKVESCEAIHLSDTPRTLLETLKTLDTQYIDRSR